MPNLLTHAQVTSKPLAPQRLDLASSRTQNTGNRLLGLLLRVAQEHQASEIWFVCQEESLVMMGKKDRKWSVLMKKHTYHGEHILDSIMQLSPAGLFTSETDGVARVWKVSSSTMANDRELFLRRV